MPRKKKQQQAPQQSFEDFLRSDESISCFDREMSQVCPAPNPPAKAIPEGFQGKSSVSSGGWGAWAPFFLNILSQLYLEWQKKSQSAESEESESEESEPE